MSKKEIKNRIGEIRCNNKGLKMEIVKYNNYNDIDVLFEDGALVHTKYSHFKNGVVKSYFYPSVVGVGYLGRSTIGEEKDWEAYFSWSSMLNRCYNKKNKEYKNYGGRGVYVCDEWLNFNTFQKWYYENKWDECATQIDKDILTKNNKVYSPKECCVVDQRINCLFTKRTLGRGCLPIGVNYNERLQKYTSQCSIENGKLKHIGCFETEKQAFLEYKRFKETNIRRVADEYKFKYAKFPNNIYVSMYNYKVEIND